MKSISNPGCFQMKMIYDTFIYSFVIKISTQYNVLDASEDRSLKTEKVPVLPVIENKSQIVGKNVLALNDFI